MKNFEGALGFDAYIADSDFNKTIVSMNRRIESLSNKTLSETEKMGLGFRNLSTVAASAFAGMGLAMLPAQIVKIRGEFQQLEIALNTMLGSKAKADQLMGQIVQFAALTPYGLKDTAEATKMLLAYGAEAETVIDTMRRLGDIASGIGAPLKDIAWLYGTTMTQGRLYTQDLNQFLGRGIPMTRELAKIFGVAENEVKGLVEAGKVGFPEVQKVIENLTNSGSMFGGLMEAQSKSLVGLQAQLGDAIDAMFNDIGRSQEGVLSAVFQGAIATVENYEKVIDVLKVVVATYGTYRAALMLTAAMQASTGLVTNIKMWADLARSVNNAKDAQILFNLATKANPYVIAATALAALVAGFVVFGREASNAEKIQNSLNEAMRKAEDSAAAEQAKIQTLTTRIKNETSSRQDRNKALQELIQLSPDHLGALSLENTATEKGTEAINNYIEAKKKQLELKEIETQLEESIKRQNSAKNQDSDLSIFDKIGISLAASGSRGEVNYSKSVAAERKRLNDDLLKQEEEVQEKLRKRIETLTGVSDATKKAGTEAEAVTRKTVSWYEEEITALKKKQEAQSEDREAYLKYQKQIDSLERQRDAITGGKQKKVAEKDKPQPYGSLAYWEQVASKANEVLSKTPAGNTGVLKKQQDIIIQAEQRIAEIRKSIAVKSFEEEIAEKQKQYELYERWVQHMGEDAAKAQFGALLTNGASYADFLNSEIAKLQNSKSPESNKQIEFLRNQLADVSGVKTPIEQFQKTLDDTRESAENLTEEIVRLKAIQEGLDKNDNSISGFQKRALVQQQLNEAEKERRKLLKDFLVNVTGSEEKRLEIERHYKDLRATLDDEFINKKSRGYQKALDNINKAEQKEYDEQQGMLAKQSKEFQALTKVIEEATKDQTKIKLEAAKKQLQIILDGYGENSEEYRKHLAEVRQLEEDHMRRSIELWSSVGGMINELGGALSNLGGKYGELGNFLSGVGSGVGKLSSALQDFKKREEDGSGMGSSGYMAIAQAAVQLTSMVIRSAQQRKQAEEDYYISVMGYERDYQTLLIKRTGLAYEDEESIFHRDLEARIQAGVAQYSEAQKAYEDALNNLDKARVKIDQKNKVDWGNVGSSALTGAATGAMVGGWIGAIIGGVGGALVGLFGGKKKGDVYGSLLEQYPGLIKEMEDGWRQLDVEMANSLITNSRVDESTKQLLLNAIAYSEQMEAAKDQIKAGLSDLSGQLGDNLKNALVGAFKEGEDAAQAFSKTVGDVIAGIVSDLMFTAIFKKAFKALEEDMTASYAGGDGDIVDDLVRWQQEYGHLAKDYAGALEEFNKWAEANGYTNIFGKTDGATGKDGLQGAIKGMSEETASVLVGQFNAIRIYQADMAGNMRISVTLLQAVAANTAFNRYLVRLENIENLLTKMEKNSLRSGGL